jgi:hypothetical protein
VFCRHIARHSQARTEGIDSKDQRRATAVKRLDIREILATKTMREITLK